MPEDIATSILKEMLVRVKEMYSVEFGFAGELAGTGDSGFAPALAESAQSALAKHAGELAGDLGFAPALAESAHAKPTGELA